MFKAKTEYIIRISGLILITLSIPIVVLSDFLLIENWLLWVFYIFCILPWIIFIITWKLMIQWIIKRGRVIRISLLGLFITFFLISLIFLNYGIKSKEFFRWLFHIIKIVSLLICWKFSFSIIKRRKLIFFSFGCFFCALTIIFLMFTLDILNLMLLSVIITFIGINCILIGEFLMLKKGLLRYL